MTVQEIIINTGVLLGRRDIIDYYADQLNFGEQTYEDVLMLVKVINLVVNELASTYFPLIKEKEVTFYNGSISYGDLEDKIVRILDVYDSRGNKVAFTDDVEYIRINDTSKKTTLTVVYQYLPEEYYEDSTIDYYEKDIPTKVLSCAVASEFCLSQGRFEEAVMHHKRYMAGIQEIKSPKNGFIKGRSWK